MSTTIETEELILEPADNRILANLCGQCDEHLRQLEQRIGVQIGNRGNHFRVMGPGGTARLGARLLRELFERAAGERLDPQRVHVFLQEAAVQESQEAPRGAGTGEEESDAVRTRRAHIRPRGPNQRAYIASIRRDDLCFGIGPAGTGKTYLAVASAVEALEQDRVRRIVLVRPAVEAGERLGFLPGDLAQKVDPYLRPMYDALYEMLGFDRVARLIERNVIEVAPLAYMRGRSLNESFIILDEAQNTTVEQMKMFLTRMGFGSRAVVTGDITQVDLPRRQLSGLRHVIQVLRDLPGVSFTFFTPRDVVRHALVQRIVEAYEEREQAERVAHEQDGPDGGGRAGPENT
ncbi:MAG: PhoH family protein [Gammaproteobacteria bacterium]|nr:MAG: PhoH family protein [Gammaproteobacteria bacterium]